MAVQDLIALIGGLAVLLSALVGLIGGLVGFVALLKTFSIEREQARVSENELFISVTRDIHERYYQLYSGLASLPERAGEQLTDEQQRAMSQYVNLCAEEYLWKQKGIIAPEVWEVWECSIRDKFSNPVVAAEWKRVHRHDKYYKGFEEFIDSIVTGSTVAN